jgi:hypothetical protein
MPITRFVGEAKKSAMLEVPVLPPPPGGGVVVADVNTALVPDDGDRLDESGQAKSK